MAKPWEIEDWRKAKGIIADEKQTNSALAQRDYSVPCEAPSENLIQIISGYWIWWCSTHHQPAALCRETKARTETIKKVEPLVKKLLEALHYIDFSNGVEAFGIDEGRVSAGEFIERCEAEWQKLKGAP